MTKAPNKSSKGWSEIYKYKEIKTVIQNINKYYDNILK